jgi:hypothetical protein
MSSDDLPRIGDRHYAVKSLRRGRVADIMKRTAGADRHGRHITDTAGIVENDDQVRRLR